MQTFREKSVIRRIESEVYKLYNDLDKAKQNVLFARQNLSLQGELAMDEKKRFELARSSVINVLVSQQDLMQAQLSYYNRESELRLLPYLILFMTGQFKISSVN